MHLVDVPKSVPKHVSSTAALFSRFNVEKSYQNKENYLFTNTLQVLQVKVLVQLIYRQSPIFFKFS